MTIDTVLWLAKTWNKMTIFELVQKYANKPETVLEMF